MFQGEISVIHVLTFLMGSLFFEGESHKFVIIKKKESDQLPIEHIQMDILPVFFSVHVCFSFKKLFKLNGFKIYLRSKTP